MADISQLITDWGYAGIFFVVILGNIGLPVPEETVLAVAGYLVWSGRLQLLPVLIVAFISAVAGDNLGYWLGRHYGRAAVERYAGWLLKPGRLMVAESFVSRYGALAVCVARFVGGFRFLAGPLAGAVGLSFPLIFARQLARGGVLRALRGWDRLRDRLRSGAVHGPCPARAGRYRPHRAALGDHRGRCRSRVAHDH